MYNIGRTNSYQSHSSLIYFVCLSTMNLFLHGGTKNMQITDIKVRKLFEEGPMKAIVSVTFDGQLAVHDIKVIYARDKFFIVMPSRKNPDETYRDIVHPINAQFRSMMERAVIEAYEAECEAARLAAEKAEDEDAFTEAPVESF